MTAVAHRAHRERRAQAPTTPVPWRSLIWVTWRQHRAALAATLLVFGSAALALVLSGVRIHATAARLGLSWWSARTWPAGYYSWAGFLPLMLQSIPVLSGLFLGSPLVARETETGTSRLAWTQGAGRTRWFIAQVAPIAVLLAVAACGLGFLVRWWLVPFVPLPVRPWGSQVFDLYPLPFAGWVTLAFSLGVFLGAVIRRTVPAMAALSACYAGLLYMTSVFWRPVYLPPLHRADPPVSYSPRGSYAVYWGSAHGPGPDIIRSNPRWPDGRPLSNADLNHTSAWFSQHGIRLWTTYQPASRFSVFQSIEFGWLVALAVILVAATVALIHRRAA